MRVRQGDGTQRDAPEKSQALTPLSAPYNDPFSYFAAVIKHEITPKNDLSSLEINQVVVEILDAAVRSAKTGKTISIK